MVKVLPKNETLRKILKHPGNNIPFPETGPLEWPDDAFTTRRIEDGDVTVYEDPKPSTKKD